MLQSENRSAKRIFFVEDFQVFGERYGIDYRFPQLKEAQVSGSPVLQGNVEEMMLSSGISLTHSDVRVLQPYETTSRHSSPLYMLVVLEGCVTLNGINYPVRPGMAFSSRLSEDQVMSARHDADSTLKTLSFGVYPHDAGREALLESLLLEWQSLNAPAFVWQVPEFVMSGILHAQRQGKRALTQAVAGGADVSAARPWPQPAPAALPAPA